MKKLFTALTISLFLFFFTTTISLAANQDVVINEIGASEPQDYEWIEIYNRGTDPIDLADWKFVEDFSDTKPNGTSHNLNFPNTNTMIGAGQYAIIAQNATKLKEKYPDFNGLLIDSSWGSLNESGEKIGLKDADGNLIEPFNYIEAKNYSLERIDANSNDYASTNWKEHADSNTLGIQNSDYASTQNATGQTDQSSINNQQTTDNQNGASSTISNSQNSKFKIQSSITADAGENIIALAGQEIIFDASKSIGDITSYEWNFGNGQISKEKIAKHKYIFPGKYIITLSVSDSSSKSQTQITSTIYPSGVYINEFIPSPIEKDTGEWIEIYNSNNFPVDISKWKLKDDGKSKGFSIPQNTFIAPKSYLVFSKDITKISLNNDTDTLHFLYPEDILIEEIKYEKTKEGFSASRNQDDIFMWTQNPTPSGPNIISSNNTSNSTSVNIQNVQASSADINNALIKNNRIIVSENNIIKNLINSAKAQTVEEQKIEQLAQNENSDTMIDARNDNGLSANIGENLKTKNNPMMKIILILATIGIFALMWQALKTKK